MLVLIFFIVLMGAIGGMVNALLSDNGFFLPKSRRVDGQKIVRPGFIGNMFIGAVSAFVSWALYGPLASVAISGPPNGAPQNSEIQTGLTLSSLGGVVLIGIAGSRWLTNEIDKTILKSATVMAARSQASNPNENATVQKLTDSMALASSPSVILGLAEDLPQARIGIGNNS
jgi:hypothetical protein